MWFPESHKKIYHYLGTVDEMALGSQSAIGQCPKSSLSVAVEMAAPMGCTATVEDEMVLGAQTSGRLCRQVLLVRNWHQSMSVDSDHTV